MLSAEFAQILINVNDKNYPFSPADRQDTNVNNVDPDETAHNEPSHQDLHCLPVCSGYRLKLLFATMDMFKFKDGGVHFRTGVKVLW